MTEMQSILYREGYMLLLHDRNAEYPMQRRFYASASWQKYRESCAEKVLCCCFMTEMRSVLYREGYMLLLHDRNTEYPKQRRFYDAVLTEIQSKYPMQRRFYDSASWQKCRVSYAEKVLCFCFMTEIQSILGREGFMILQYDRNVAYPMQRKLCPCPSWKCIHMHTRLCISPSSYKWQIQPFQSS